MDQSIQKVLLVLTQLGIQTFTSSTPPISFFSIKVSILIVLYLKRFVRFSASQSMISASEFESWWARFGKNDFSSDMSRNSNSSFSKTTAVNSCIKIQLTLSYYYRILTLKSLWFFPYFGLFFHQDLHRQFFLSRMRFFPETKCCIFNITFLCRLHGKYRSATALIVFFYLGCNEIKISECPEKENFNTRSKRKTTRRNSFIKIVNSFFQKLDESDQYLNLLVMNKTKLVWDISKVLLLLR